MAHGDGAKFVLILPDTDRESAHTLAERCLQRIRDEAIPHASSRVAPTLTASAGVSSSIPDATGGTARLVEAADRALYQAQRNGRNRIAITDSPRAG